MSSDGHSCFSLCVWGERSRKLLPEQIGGKTQDISSMYYVQLTVLINNYCQLSHERQKGYTLEKLFKCQEMHSSDFISVSAAWLEKPRMHLIAVDDENNITQDQGSGKKKNVLCTQCTRPSVFRTMYFPLARKHFHLLFGIFKTPFFLRMEFRNVVELSS